jgi:hypothetical protein
LEIFTFRQEEQQKEGEPQRQEEKTYLVALRGEDEEGEEGEEGEEETTATAAAKNGLVR